MAIRKKDLMEFIENKASKRKNELSEVVRAKVKEALQPIVKERYKEMEPIERQVQSVYDKLTDVLGDSRYTSKQYIKNVARDINSHILGFRDAQLRRQVNLAIHNMLDGGTNGLYDDCYPVVEAVEQDMAEQIDRYKAHSNLTSEIIAIINASTNGNKAYDRLKELGVDLTGFEGSPAANLPAVIKLSSNVCIFNGDCQ